MRSEDFNDRKLQELENELRSFGAPYSGSEPDSRYFANFRARVMERIREEEAAKARPWYENALGWIEEHVLVTSLSSAAVLVAVWAALMIQPLEPVKHQMAVATQATPSQVQPTPLEVPKQNLASAAESPKFATPVASNTAPKNVVSHSNDVIDRSHDVAALEVPVMSVADEVGPVNLDELSAPELESVLKTLETE
jgi:hypothetical protein